MGIMLTRAFAPGGVPDLLARAFANRRDERVELA